MLGRALSGLEKIVVFIVSFAIVAFVYVSLNLWKTDLTTYFFRTDRWWELIFISASVLVINSILTKLLQWEIRIQTRKKRRR